MTKVNGVFVREAMKTKYELIHVLPAGSYIPTATYFYRRDDNEIVEVWYDPYQKLWTAFVVNNINDRNQQGDAVYGYTSEIEDMIWSCTRYAWR